jgi:hypothetical protein
LHRQGRYDLSETRRDCIGNTISFEMEVISGSRPSSIADGTAARLAARFSLV